MHALFARLVAAAPSPVASHAPAAAFSPQLMTATNLSGGPIASSHPSAALVSNTLTSGVGNDLCSPASASASPRFELSTVSSVVSAAADGIPSAASALQFSHSGSQACSPGSFGSSFALPPVHNNYKCSWTPPARTLKVSQAGSSVVADDGTLSVNKIPFVRDASGRYRSTWTPKTPAYTFYSGSSGVISDDAISSTGRSSYVQDSSGISSETKYSQDEKFTSTYAPPESSLADDGNSIETESFCEDRKGYPDCIPAISVPNSRSPVAAVYSDDRTSSFSGDEENFSSAVADDGNCSETMSFREDVQANPDCTPAINPKSRSSGTAVHSDDETKYSSQDENCDSSPATSASQCSVDGSSSTETRISPIRTRNLPNFTEIGSSDWEIRLVHLESMTKFLDSCSEALDSRWVQSLLEILVRGMEKETHKKLLIFYLEGIYVLGKLTTTVPSNHKTVVVALVKMMNKSTYASGALKAWLINHSPTRQSLVNFLHASQPILTPKALESMVSVLRYAKDTEKFNVTVKKLVGWATTTKLKKELASLLQLT
eukprot:TRINITY_DN1147_c0_g1_i2.p1 TRINITY_DN1147_c0_g1~~TRINITY_DN1147_c0_g1_i2.p1  ORF type:complete len:545 (-),score=121.85 TRINITY_DN1147_c0_g1_i2:1381-3015(-)